MCGDAAVLLQQKAELELVRAVQKQLLTRLSATQQLRAINPALEVP